MTRNKNGASGAKIRIIDDVYIDSERQAILEGLQSDEAVLDAPGGPAAGGHGRATQRKDGHGRDSRGYPQLSRLGRYSKGQPENARHAKKRLLARISRSLTRVERDPQAAGRLPPAAKRLVEPDRREQLAGGEARVERGRVDRDARLGDLGRDVSTLDREEPIPEVERDPVGDRPAQAAARLPGESAHLAHAGDRGIELRQVLIHAELVAAAADTAAEVAGQPVSEVVVLGAAVQRDQPALLELLTLDLLERCRPKAAATSEGQAERVLGFIAGEALGGVNHPAELVALGKLAALGGDSAGYSLAAANGWAARARPR